MLNSFKHKVLQISENCFLSILKLYFFQNFCKKLARFIPLKTCLMVIRSFQMVDIVITKSN